MVHHTRLEHQVECFHRHIGDIRIFRTRRRHGDGVSLLLDLLDLEHVLEYPETPGEDLAPVVGIMRRDLIQIRVVRARLYAIQQRGGRLNSELLRLEGSWWLAVIPLRNDADGVLSPDFPPVGDPGVDLRIGTPDDEEEDVVRESLPVRVVVPHGTGRKSR